MFCLAEVRHTSQLFFLAAAFPCTQQTPGYGPYENYLHHECFGFFFKTWSASKLTRICKTSAFAHLCNAQQRPQAPLTAASLAPL